MLTGYQKFSQLLIGKSERESKGSEGQKSDYSGKLSKDATDKK